MLYHAQEVARTLGLILSLVAKSVIKRRVTEHQKKPT